MLTQGPTGKSPTEAQGLGGNRMGHGDKGVLNSMPHCNAVPGETVTEAHSLAKSAKGRGTPGPIIPRLKGGPPAFLFGQLPGRHVTQTLT